MSTTSPLPPCMLVVDEEEDLICNKPGFEEIWVRNKFGRFAVTLCRECREEHYRFYEEERAARAAEDEKRQLRQRASMERRRTRSANSNPSGSNPGSRQHAVSGNSASAKLRHMPVEDERRTAEQGVREFVRRSDLRETVQADRPAEARFSATARPDNGEQVRGVR